MQNTLPVDVVRDARSQHNVDVSRHVVQVTSPDQLAKTLSDGDGFLIVYRDSCPYCRALHRTLIDLLVAMRRDDALSNSRIYFLDSARHGKFANEQLAVRGVPSIFLVQGGRVHRWSDEPMVRTERDERDGSLQKRLPLANMLATMRGADAERQRKERVQVALRNAATLRSAQ